MLLLVYFFKWNGKWMALGVFFRGSFANIGVGGWSLQGSFSKDCSLTSAFPFFFQLKAVRAAASSRGGRLKSGPSGRASITTSRVETSTHTRSPARPRCSRWAEPSKPWVLLLLVQITVVVNELGCLQGLEQLHVTVCCCGFALLMFPLLAGTDCCLTNKTVFLLSF